jgi:hypothetical protein
MKKFPQCTSRRLSALLFLAALFLLPFCVFADTYDEVEGTGLLVKSDPEGGKVFIDGVERGETPLSLPSIRNGEYSIRLFKEGYVERRFRVVIRSKSRIVVLIDLEEAKGELIPEISRSPDAPASLPFEPALYVDGTRMYDQVLRLPAGWHTVSVSAFGWEKHTETVYVAEGEARRLPVVLRAAAFSAGEISHKRRRFNPDNQGALGTTEISFEVSAPGRGGFEVLDGTGHLVFSRELGPFTTWHQSVSWNGRDGGGLKLPDGPYILRLTAAGGEGRVNKEFNAELDSSIEILPLAAASSLAGLFCSSSPETLPSGSYQIEGTLLAGKPPFDGDAWNSLPFALALRFSILDRLECSAALNISPRFGESALAGTGASVKWAFTRPGTSSFGAAAAFSYGWAEEGPFTTFGMGTGAGLSFPLSLRVVSDPGVDILLSPTLLWAGPRGYPENWLPRLGGGTGVLVRHKSVSGGLSVRWDYAPEVSSASGLSGAGPLLSAAEFRFSPSNLMVSLSGGYWYLNGEGGAFFGAALGVIY